MYTLSLMLTGQITPVVLVFEKSEHWAKARDRVASCIRGETAGPVVLHDDFDGGLNCLGSSIAFASWQDIARQHQAEGERQVIAAHANVDLQSRARNDPKLQAAARMTNLAQGGQLVRSQ
jgi:hypothetical protein